MKKIVFALAMLLSVSGAMAQNEGSENKGRGGSFPQNEEEMTTLMVKKLNLSDAQQAKVKKLNKKYADLFQRPSRGGGKGPGTDSSNGQSTEEGQRPEPPQMTDSQRQQMESEMKARKQKREAYEKELKAILSSEQYTSYQKLMPQRGQRPKKESNQ